MVIRGKFNVVRGVATENVAKSTVIMYFKSLEKASKGGGQKLPSHVKDYLVKKKKLIWKL